MYRVHLSGLSALLFLTVVTVPAPLSGQEAPVAADRWNRAALEWIGLLSAGSFQEAGARVDPSVPEGAMGPDQLETIWGQLSAQLGALETLEPGIVAPTGGYHVVRLPATFEGQSLIIQVTLTESLLISGLFFVPAEPPPYDSPPYVREDSFQEVEVAIGTEQWVLPGVLTLPLSGRPVPAVVLVHGSGPNDRDETIGGSRPFRDLAWGLASRGVAVLRYDKRTRVHGQKLPPDIGLEEEVVEDALKALDVLRGRGEVDPEGIFLLGHSLGGMMAPEIGYRDGSLAGIAVLAAPARPFFEVLIGQLEYIASLESDPDSPGRAQLESLLSDVRRVESGEVPDDQAILGAPPPYWREVAAVNPVSRAGDLSTPIFVLQGGRDYQSTPEDLELWIEALGEREAFSSKLYPALNHLFAPGSGKATPEEYVSTTQHVAEEVILDLAEWIRRITG